MIIFSEIVYHSVLFENFNDVSVVPNDTLNSLCDTLFITKLSAQLRETFSHNMASSEPSNHLC